MTNPAGLVEERYGGPSYGIIAWARGEDRLFYEQFGSYQGEWLMLTRDGAGVYRLYKDWYGSCSGCDAYEAEFDDDPTRAQAEVFAAKYPPFAEIPRQTMRNLARRGTLKRVLPLNTDYNANDDRPHLDYEGDSIDRVASEMIVAVKVMEDLPLTLEDVLHARNAEVKQRALRAYGYERFVEDAKGTVLHRDGVDSLVRITAPDKEIILFLSVQDSSTDRRYLLRVPATMKTVREAKAWTFGLESQQYQPEIET